jgi:hypothetical protein
MSIELYLILLLAAVCAMYFVLPVVTRTFARYRGNRVISCPETRKPAAIKVDAVHAAMTAAIKHPDLRLRSCSRWPEREDCGQECLLQVQLSPEDCLIRNILTGWYAGKNCVSCGNKIGEIRWSDHKPALLSPEGKTVEWQEIAPENVPTVLATHFPVCWDCHITESFCREHPEMIVDRSRINATVDRHMRV